MRALFFSFAWILSSFSSSYADDSGCKWWINTNFFKLIKEYDNYKQVYKEYGAIKEKHIPTFYWVLGLIREQMSFDQEQLPFVKKSVKYLKRNAKLPDNRDTAFFNEYYKNLLENLNYQISWQACGTTNAHVQNERYQFGHRCLIKIDNNKGVDLDVILRSNMAQKLEGWPKNVEATNHNIMRFKDSVVSLDSIDGFLSINFSVLHQKVQDSPYTTMFKLDPDYIFNPPGQERIELLLLPEGLVNNFDEFAAKRCRTHFQIYQN